MADQNFLDLVRNYLWKTILWRNNEGYNNSFDELQRIIKRDIHHALKGDYLFGLGNTYKERYARAAEILEQHSAEVNEVIEEQLLKLGKKNAKVMINKITAQAIIEPLLNNAGFIYYIDYQKTGAKLNVVLLPKKKAVLYMSYGKIMKESGRLVENILKIKQMYEYFGHNSGIVNISGKDYDKFK